MIMTYGEAKSRARAIVGEMTAEEAASQLLYNSPAIDRLGIREYNWWNEALHGVARAGTATVFPQAIGMAATFDPALVGKVAEAISTEGRAKYSESIKRGDRDIYKGLTYWSPNINIFRDPRWGRGQETYGEDPFLTSEMGASFIRGIQGDGEFLRAAACAKHFAVHSGPEKLRHEFDAKISIKDLYETYLPAFETAVKRAGVVGVMGAYNSVNGEPCCVNKLLHDILRDDWGFDGYFVSDCGALADIAEGHHFTENDTESAAAALKNECDLNCGWVYDKLLDAYEADLVTEDEIKNAAVRVFAIRVLLGEYEEKSPFPEITYDRLDCAAHSGLNLTAARESMVLLKNENGILPLDKNKVKTIAVVGANVQSRLALEGNYNGHASEYITVADGVRRIFDKSTVRVEKGSNLYHEKLNDFQGFGNMISAGVAAAASSDVTILCVGLDRTIEGEECSINADYSDSGDKRNLYLPETQRKLAEAVCDTSANVIVVIMAGSAIDLGDKVTAHAKAIIAAWYPGALGGLAVASLIAGEYSPGGRLPVTFYRGDAALPDFTDYSMKGRTYRYLTEAPRYPFGFGLGYTSFRVSSPSVIETESGVRMTVTVTNDSRYSGSEPVQVYAKFNDSRYSTPNYQLCAVKRVWLLAGETTEITLDTDKYWLCAVSDTGERVKPDGKVTLYAGFHQPDGLSTKLSGTGCVSVSLSD